VAVGVKHLPGDPPVDRRASAPFQVSSGHAPRLVLRLTGGVIAGRVVDAQGAGVPGVNVQAVPPNALAAELSLPGEASSHLPRFRFLERNQEGRAPATDLERMVAATSGDEGRFRLEAVPAGTYELRGWKEGFVRGPVATPATVGQMDAVVQLTPVGHLRGHCVDGRGQPVTTFTLDFKTFNSATGAFESEVSEDGPTTLRFGADGFVALEKTFDGRVGQETDVGIVTLVAGRRLEGEVVDEASGKPVVGATASWSISDAPWDFTREMRGGMVRTDEKGRFEMSGLEPTAGNVRVQSVGHPQTEVPVAQGQTFVRIVLAAGMTVTGRVIGAKGVPLAGAQVTARDANDSESSAVSASDGSYALQGLAAGNYWVTAVASSANARGSFPAKALTVTEGGTAVLDFRAPDQCATLVVRVKSPSRSEPWESAFLVQGDFPVPASLAEWTAAQGPTVMPINDSMPWTFSCVPLGQYSLFLMKGLWSTLKVDRELVTLEQEGEQQLEVVPGPNVKALPTSP
jgi:hypothetical protein